MGIVCKECGFENEDGAVVCVLCNEPLRASEDVSPLPKMRPEERVNTIPQTAVKMENSASRYYVICEECRGKTYVSGPDIASYFCPGCQKEQMIDGMLWSVEEEQSSPQTTTIPTAAEQSAGASYAASMQTMGDRLVLEDIDTGMQIEIGKAGGTLGRYGTFGANYFQTDPRGGWISGEHCRITYSEDSGWMLEHLSRTNDTVYNNRKLEHGYQERIRDGKLLVLANKMTFRIRIL